MDTIGILEKAKLEGWTDEEVIERVKAGDTALYEIVMRRYNQRLYRVARAILHDECTIGIGHFETVDHHHSADGYLHARTSQTKHLRNVSILEIKFAGKFVIFLIEGAAGNENSNGHGSICAEPMHLSKFRVGD